MNNLYIPHMDKLQRQYRSNDRQHHLRIAQTNIPQKVYQHIDTRKCLTPCLAKSKPKSKLSSKPKYVDTAFVIPHTKDRNKSSQRRDESKTKRKVDSKLKNKSGTTYQRPSSTMANVRFSKQLENHQNSNESVIKFDYKLDEDISMVRIKDISFKTFDNKHLNKELLSLLNEGKKQLKNSNFIRADQCFKESLKYHDGNNIEVLYLLGICNFHLEKYHECIKYLNTVLLKDDSYRKNVFFFLAISYKRIDDIQSALQILTITILESPKNYEALLFRGKLLSKEKRYQEAINDFNKCIQFQPNKIAPILSKADALRGMKNLQESSLLYSEILNKYPDDVNIRLKRSHCYLEMDKLELAKNDLDQILRIEFNNSEAYYFKGIIFYKTRNYNDALLSFQQAIKHNSSKKATTKSLYEIAKIKIQLRDFYGASYTLERSDSFDVDKKSLEKIKLFIDGSTFLMKKKTKKGVQLLSNLIKKQTIPEFIKIQTYSFRSYGYFCQYKYTHALNDLIQLEKMGFYLDEASCYNKIILEGVIATQNHRYEQALIKFQECERIRPLIADPSIYKALTLIQMYNKSSMNEKIVDILQQSVKSCTLALNKEENNWNCSFIRATLYYTLGDYDKALSDIEKAIDKSDDHVIKHFYLRAMIYSAMEKYKESLGDFGNVLTLMKDLREKSMQSKQEDVIEKEKEMPEAYLNRAKCYLLFNEKRRAFQDLQSYISYRPLDSEIHIMAGKLLFSIGAHEDAIKAYGHCPNIDMNTPVLLERLKCYLLMKELNLCLKDMQKIADSGDMKIMFDYICLDSLRESSKNTTEHIRQALKNIKKLQNNSERGYIFSKSDYHFYQGVLHFYLKNYPQALKEFNKTLELKVLDHTLHDMIHSKSNSNLDQNEQENDDEYDSYQNRIFTLEELKYNIGVTHLVLKNKAEAAKILQKYKGFKTILDSNYQIQYNHSQSISQSSKDQDDITPFPTSNRLCSIFPTIVANKYQFRLSFCLPKVQPPETQLKIQQELIQKLNINCTQARPDAPWIKRNSFGVVFTQDLMGCDIDLETQQEQSGIQYKEENHNSSPPQVVDRNQDRKRFKDSLLLDPATEARLAKMLH